MDYQKVANEWETYDYESAMMDDVKEAVSEYISWHKDEGDLPESLEDARDDIYDVLWTEDHVTGNGSGSYTMSRMLADLFLIGNGYLYEEALKELGGEYDPEPENRDVTIRCYLLSSTLDKVLEDEEIIKEFEAAKKG